jgi:hypothetical protein
MYTKPTAMTANTSLAMSPSRIASCRPLTVPEPVTKSCDGHHRFDGLVRVIDVPPHLRALPLQSLAMHVRVMQGAKGEQISVLVDIRRNPPRLCM